MTTTTTTVTTPTDDPPPEGVTLAEVRDRGLRCGIGEREGFSTGASTDNPTGFDVDFCRALAAAVGNPDQLVFGDASSSSERFNLLMSGEIDVLIRTTTYTLGRDVVHGLDFGPTTYYDGQQLLGDTDLFSKLSTLAELEGLRVCVSEGTTTFTNLFAEVGALDVLIEAVPAENSNAAIEDFRAGECEAVTADGTQLLGLRVDDPQHLVIFPNPPISREPLGPVYRAGDTQWADIVDWTTYALIIADEHGVTQANVDTMREDPPNQEVARLLGERWEDDEINGRPAGYLQRALGLQPDAFLEAIRAVGNYGEIFERNLARLDLDRDGSLNASWKDGGLIYAPPATPE